MNFNEKLKLVNELNEFLNNSFISGVCKVRSKTRINSFSIWEPDMFQIGKSIVGQTTILNTYHRMKPLVTKVVTISQGSSDPTSAWAKARFNWVKQLGIRFGVIDPTKDRDPPMPGVSSEEEEVRNKVKNKMEELIGKIEKLSLTNDSDHVDDFSSLDSDNAPSNYSNKDKDILSR